MEYGPRSSPQTIFKKRREEGRGCGGVVKEGINRVGIYGFTLNPIPVIEVALANGNLRKSSPVKKILFYFGNS